MAYCWILAGYKNYHNKYKKQVDVISQSNAISKHKEDTHFTLEYVNNLFGLEEKKNNENDDKSKNEVKFSFKDIFSQVIPKHLFQKPKRRSEYFEFKKTNKDSQNITSSINFNPKSMTELTKESLFDTPKTYNPEERLKQLKKSFTTSKKKKQRLYQSNTISFSAKIKNKSQENQNTPPINKPKFIIKTKTNTTFDEVFRVEKEKLSLTPQPQFTKIPFRNFVLKSKDIIKREILHRTSFENLRTPERSFSNIKSKCKISK